MDEKSEDNQLYTTEEWSNKKQGYYETLIINRKKITENMLKMFYIESYVLQVLQIF